MLRDPEASKAQKQLALKFLVHLIQDSHQPLHVGDNGNRGGTQLQVRFFNIGTNFHRLWDSQIMEWHTSRDKAQ